MMNKTRFLPVKAFLLAFTFILLQLACNRTPQDGQSTPSVVHIGSPFVAVDFAPYYVARSKGWFEEALKGRGAKPEYISFQSVPPINESFATGRVDFVFVAEPPIIVGKSAGINEKIIGLSCSLVQEILVPANSSIKSIADLKGKKVAVLFGSSSHYGLLKLLKEAGLDSSDLEIIDMAPPDAKSAFETNQVDAWAVWPPFVEQEEIAGKGRVLPRGDAFIQSILAARGDFIRQNPDLTRDIVSVLNRAKQWIRDNPDEAQAIVAKEVNVPLDVVKRAWPRHDWAAQLDEEVITDIQAKAAFLQSNGFIKNSIDVRKDLIDLSFLK